LFQHHHEEAQEHERLIRERLEAHGETPSRLKELGGRFAAMAKEVASTAPPSDSPGRLARDGYVQGHTEIAAYELCRVAERAGDTETAEVGRRILENERQTADKIADSWDHATELALREAGVAT
jgi:ferritin-like metal-binding protein YciE